MPAPLTESSAAIRPRSTLPERLPRALRWGFFGAVVALLLAFSPLDLRGMGYSDEEVAAALRLHDWLFGGPSAPAPEDLLSGRGVLTRHGLVEPVIKLPAAAVGRGIGALVPGSRRFAERFVALTPILETAAFATLLFAWAAELTGSAGLGWALAVGGLFGTSLWPYAYIGLEPTQGLALLAAGYLALSRREERLSRARLLLFTLAATSAVATKSTGALLLPAVCYLVWSEIRLRSSHDSKRRGLSVAVAITALLFAAVAASKLLRNAFQPAWIEAETLHYFLETNPVRVASSLSMLLFSANKGLLFYCPLAFLGLLALPRAARRHRSLAFFGFLTLSFTATGFAIIGVPAEETWGPRYLYVAIGPLLLCLAAGWGGLQRSRLRQLVVAGALVGGVGVAALGTLYYYGRTFQAADRVGQATLEALWGDPVWNPIVMHMRLARIRLSPPGTTAIWTPQHHIWFERPRDLPPDRSVDLTFALDPQPLMLRRRTQPAARLALLTSLAVGLSGLAWTCRRLGTLEPRLSRVG